MADWANTVVGLWDLAVRIANFANDIRSAQDDFVGLRAEAECLLICINSLNSPSCRDALYRYISADQATDLDTLVKNTDLNMRELNQFIAKCWRLVERDLGRDGLRRRGWRRLGMRLKQSVAKTWAKYWFAMADKQAYRDKLVLPAQSVNIYLTSLTHIGLVNVGFLMQLSGHGSAGGCNCACGGGRGGRGGGGGRSGGGGGGGRGGGSGPDGDAPVIVLNPLHDWKAVGRQLAFKEAIARRTDLTPDLEEEIIAYALHLMNGGARFNSRPSGSGSTGGKQKFTKTTKTTKTTTRVRSRSRSRAPTGGGMGRGSDRMYLVRKKSTSRPSASRVEIVDLEASDSDDNYPRRPLLALPAPDTPSSGSGPRLIEIKPPRRPSGSSPSDGSDSSGPGRRPQRSPTPSPPPSPPVFTASGALHPDDDHNDTSARRFERMRSSRARHTSRRTAGLDMSREELQARRRMVLERIQTEADAAAAELEAKQAESREERRRYRHEVRQSSGSHHQPSPQQEQDEDKKDDILMMCSIIEEEYGVRVIPLPEGTREPIFAPKVKPAVPLDDDEMETEHSGDEFHIRKEKKKDNGRRRSSARNRRTAVESSASDGSEEEDEILVKSMSRRQNSRLKAETSLLGSTMAGHSHGPRTFGYEDPYVRSRSHSYYPEPASYRPPARFEPYPTRPYDRTRERERRHSEYPSQFFQDEKDISPQAEREGYLNLGLHPGYSRMRSRHQPNVRDDSEDDSLYGAGRPVPGPKGPGPAPPAPAVLEIHRSDEHMEDIVRERELRRAHEREGPSIRIVDHPPSSLRPRVYQHRSAPGDIQHPEVVVRRHDSGSEDDYDQRVRMVRS